MYCTLIRELLSNLLQKNLRDSSPSKLLLFPWKLKPHNSNLQKNTKVCHHHVLVVGINLAS